MKEDVFSSWPHRTESSGRMPFYVPGSCHPSWAAGRCSKVIVSLIHPLEWTGKFCNKPNARPHSELPKWKGAHPSTGMLDFNVQSGLRSLVQAEGKFSTQDRPGQRQSTWSLRQKEKCGPHLHLSKHPPFGWTTWEKVIKSLTPEIMTIYIKSVLIGLFTHYCEYSSIRGLCRARCGNTGWTETAVPGVQWCRLLRQTDSSLPLFKMRTVGPSWIFLRWFRLLIRSSLNIICLDSWVSASPFNFAPQENTFFIPSSSQFCTWVQSLPLLGAVT